MKGEKEQVRMEWEGGGWADGLGWRKVERGLNEDGGEGGREIGRAHV